MSNLYNMKLKQGSDERFILTYKDALGDIIDLTGYSARLQVRRQVSSPSPTLSLTMGLGITITALSGVITIDFTNAQTSSLNGSYVYDLELISPDTRVRRIMQGSITVDPEVTR